MGVSGFQNAVFKTAHCRWRHPPHPPLRLQRRALSQWRYRQCRANGRGSVDQDTFHGLRQSSCRMVREVGTLAQRVTVHLGSLRFQQTRHVFDPQHVDPLFDELVDEVQVVLECILGFLGVRDITGVTDGCFNNTARPFRRIDTKPHLRRAVSSREREECRPLRFQCSSANRRPGRYLTRSRQPSSRNRRWHYHCEVLRFVRVL